MGCFCLSFALRNVYYTTYIRIIVQIQITKWRCDKGKYGALLAARNGLPLLVHVYIRVRTVNIL